MKSAAVFLFCLVSVSYNSYFQLLTARKRLTIKETKTPWGGSTMISWFQGFKQNLRAPGGKLWNFGVWNNWSIYPRDSHMALLPIQKLYGHLKKWYHMTVHEHCVLILSLVVLFLEPGPRSETCEINEKKFIFHLIGSRNEFSVTQSSETVAVFFWLYYFSVHLLAKKDLRY